MTAKPDKQVALDGADLAAVNAALSPSTQYCIESMTHPDPKQRRGIDFDAIDKGMAAAERLVASQGPDTILGAMQGNSPAGLLAYVRNIAEAAAPFRPKVRRS